MNKVPLATLGKKTTVNASGSALIVTVMIIAVLCLIAGTLMSYSSAKQSGPFQAASWHEAGAAAEGGVEIGLNALRRSITEGSDAWDGWTADPDYAPTAQKYITESQILSHIGEGNNYVKAIVEITKPTLTGINPAGISSNRYAYLIRSTGVAYVPGPTRLPVDGSAQYVYKSDLALRKINVLKDFRTGFALPTDPSDGKVHPQITRVVEAIAAPVTPFTAAIMSQDTIEIKGGSGMIVDSYDPTVAPYKYDYGKARGDVTQPGNKRNNGNLATNAKKKDNGDVVRLENVGVYGLIAKGQGNVNIKTPGATVSGEIIDGFYRSLEDVQNPSTISSFNGLSASNIADRPSKTKGYSKTIQVFAGKGNGTNGPETTYYKFNKIHLHKDEIFKVSPYNASGQKGGNVEVWVTGDIVIHNQGLIQVDDGANVVFYVGGNITLQEKDANHPAIDNNSLKAKNADTTGGIFANPAAIQFYGAATNKKKKNVKIKSNLAAMFYAPNSDFDVNLKSGSNRAIYGALVGRKFKIGGSTQVHYDESTSDYGKPFDYTLVSWQEDWYDPLVRKN